MNILITGAKGQLGQSIVELFSGIKPSGSLNVYSLGSNDLNISNQDEVFAVFNGLQPNLVINAAAYTNVDQAEIEPVDAYKANQHGAANIAAAAAEYNARLIHVSSDYVFGANNYVPIKETVMPAPLNVYGASKLAGEQAVIEHYPYSIIVRTSAVYSAYGNNFVKAILKAGLNNGYVEVVFDQVSCPTWANSLASALKNIGLHNNVPAGVYHYAGDTTYSWYGFAKQILACASNIDSKYKGIKLIPISTQQSGRRAVRPRFSALNTSKLNSYGIKPDRTSSSLPVVVANLLTSNF